SEAAGGSDTAQDEDLANANLTQLAPLLKKPRTTTSGGSEAAGGSDTAQDEDLANASALDPSVQAAAALLFRQPVKVTHPFPRRRRSTQGERAPTSVESAQPGAASSLPQPNSLRNLYRWSKRLSKSDVNKNEKNERNLMSLGVGSRTAARVMADQDDIYK